MLLVGTELCFLPEEHKTKYHLMFSCWHDPKEGKLMPALADALLFITVIVSPHVDPHKQIRSDGFGLTRTWTVVDIWNKGVNV